MHSPIGWDDVPMNSQGINRDSVTNISNTQSNTHNTTSLNNPNTPNTLPTNEQWSSQQ